MRAPPFGYSGLWRQRRRTDPDYSPQASCITETHVVAEQVIAGNRSRTTGAWYDDLVMLTTKPALNATDMETNRVITEAC